MARKLTDFERTHRRRIRRVTRLRDNQPVGSDYRKLLDTILQEWEAPGYLAVWYLEDGYEVDIATGEIVRQ